MSLEGDQLQKVILFYIRSLTDLSLTIPSSSPPASGANNREVSELRSMISNLTKRVEVLTEERTSEGPRNRSLSPVLSRENRRALPPITDKNFKKTVHDEVIHIINNLDSSILFDTSKTFSKQKKSINKKLLPAVKAAMPPSLEVYDTELLKVIKQLHKSRQEIWKLKKEGKIDEHNKRQHMTSRRDQKMTRRRKGLQHMIFTQDSILDDCRPENMTREVFIKDCEKAVNTAEVHSDEWSTEDEVLANEERNDNIRSGRLISTNSVIKIHNKEWRSSRVKRILFRADEIGVSIGTGLSRKRYHLDDIDKKSRPTQDMANWWISSRWIEPESDDDDDDEDNDGDNNDDDNNGNDDNNDDDNNGNGDNNDDGNNGNADKNDGTNEEQNDDNNGNLEVDEHQGPFYLEVPVDIRRRT
ncbi:hypothetical protein GLOIN_2v1477808 [Rhizophagus clarus]|uniref:Uncharacterized protein n=1 Tax=Rhizophagus clarus TaxID=94130 RepID=A0A8H3KV00_9GLOM|nr:hypothetical protein GLOIN_2v1477808 [Rhizophagus clarus]